MSPAEHADSADGTEKVLVIIPTFNERENLPRILDRLRAAVPTASVLVVDDGSPDGTGDIADERAGADPMIAVLHRTEKNGLGPAYFAGFEWGLAHGFERAGGDGRRRLARTRAAAQAVGRVGSCRSGDRVAVCARRFGGELAQAT